MKTVKEQMDEIKVESYKDCVWYLEDLDKCKLPGLDRAHHSECYCKDKEMEEICTWVTKFLKSTSTDKEDEKVDVHWDEYNDLVFSEEFKDIVKLENPLIKFLKKLHIIS